MTAPIEIFIAGRKLRLSSEEAKFLSEHLRTALVNPGMALCFRHNSGGENGHIILERAPALGTRPDSAVTTDC